ncbi:MAG: cytochrome c oxidase subunit 3 family protein [Deltaproteobacteria bacterium]|nr:MAG: cytochrome c oxidase subunit 3 family protein [Deltaproteobacteria bacterium]
MSEAAALPPGEHPARGADPHLAHHFSSLERQVDASRLGMWLFLCTEVLLFAGLFTGYAVYRYSFPIAFAASARTSEIWAGTLNTVVLITSSLTVALAIHFVRTGRQRAAVVCLLITLAFALTFLGIKAIEYTAHFHEHQLPGRYYRFEGVRLPGASMYWALYFLMTGLHGLHVLIGMSVLGVIAWRTSRGYYTPHYYVGIELAGLYWHLVDLIWIFLFPLLYLI